MKAVWGICDLCYQEARARVYDADYQSLRRGLMAKNDYAYKTHGYGSPEHQATVKAWQDMEAEYSHLADRETKSVESNVLELVVGYHDETGDPLDYQLCARHLQAGPDLLNAIDREQTDSGA